MSDHHLAKGFSQSFNSVTNFTVEPEELTNSKTIIIWVYRLTLLQPSYFDQSLQPRKLSQHPGFLTSLQSYFGKLFMSVFSGLRNSIVIVKILYLYHMTLKLEVMFCLWKGCYCAWPSPSRSWSGSTKFIHRFSNSLTQKTDTDTKITFL